MGDKRVDFFGDQPGWPLLNRLNYWSRPMPILFAAWNPALERANEAFYRDPQTAPEYVDLRPAPHQQPLCAAG